ncbi:6-phosphogluconate dehydrogenase [Pelagophyceae sp. CCMP2097]|nr:6-phosphogluconate dehydrogenase [Pelagophyceae sp. CCMP2097]
MFGMAARSAVGLIGCGNLGSQFGLRRAAVGHLIAYDVHAPAAQALIQAARDQKLSSSAESASSVADVVSRSFAVVSIVPSDEALRQVAEKLLQSPGARDVLHVSCSTVSPAASRQVAAMHAAAGVRFVAAPIFARPENMRDGQASFAVAGCDLSARDSARSVLSCAAPWERCFDFGDDAGAANVVKLSGNFLIASAIEALAEAMALAEAHGVDRTALHDMLTSTVFDCPIYKGYGRRVASRDHRAGGFSLDLGLKDVSLVCDAARAKDVPMAFASVLRDRLVASKNEGLSHLDWSALALRASSESGVDIGPFVEASTRPVDVQPFSRSRRPSDPPLEK